MLCPRSRRSLIKVVKVMRVRVAEMGSGIFRTGVQDMQYTILT
jgi:hypothetical protein